MKHYTKPIISVTKLEAEDIIKTSGILEQSMPSASVTKPDGTMVSNMTSVTPQSFENIYN